MIPSLTHAREDALILRKESPTEAPGSPSSFGSTKDRAVTGQGWRSSQTPHTTPIPTFPSPPFQNVPQPGPSHLPLLLMTYQDRVLCFCPSSWRHEPRRSLGMTVSLTPLAESRKSTSLPTNCLFPPLSPIVSPSTQPGSHSHIRKTQYLPLKMPKNKVLQERPKDWRGWKHHEGLAANPRHPGL